MTEPLSAPLRGRLYSQGTQKEVNQQPKLHIDLAPTHRVSDNLHPMTPPQPEVILYDDSTNETAFNQTLKASKQNRIKKLFTFNSRG